MIDSNPQSQVRGSQPDLEATSGLRVRQSVEAATQAERMRDSLCVSSSPGQCFVLTFTKDLYIQPHVLLHALKLPEECKASLNTMSSQAGLEARARFLRDPTNIHDYHIFMDLRAPLSPDSHKKVVRRLNMTPFIKGAYLAFIKLLTYKPADSASNTS